MDYYYKYLKYKKKYLDLKGGKIEYGLYGFYSYKANDLNLREYIDKSKYSLKEKNYIHDLPLNKDQNGDNIIIQHLRSKCRINDDNNIIEYYPNIKSFQFVPYDNISQDDNDKIQELINSTYFTKQLNIKDDKVKWTTLNKLKKFRYRGYSDDISKKIINSYAAKANELLENKLYEIPDNSTVSGDSTFTTKRKDALNLTKQRTCENIHLNPNPNPNTNSNLIILNELIDKNQLLLSNIETGDKYNNYNKIYRDPYLLHSEKLGALSWNMVINKATINCIMNNDTEIFPIRIVLNMKPDKLYYDNIKDTKKYENYMGFFLIRFENNFDALTTNSKPHDSKEQYYIFFVFKNDSIFDFKTYTLTNFRNNIVSWGNVTEKKTVLFYEIIQLMCMHKNDNVFFYLISDKKQQINKLNDLITSWIHKDHLKYLYNFLNFVYDNEIHILVSKYNINNVCQKLGLEEDKIQNRGKYQYIEYNEYELTQCHFDWYDDNEKFCIKFGNMNQLRKDNLELCISDDKYFNFDKLRYIQPTAQTNTLSDNESRKFDIESILNLELQTLIDKI